MKNPKSADAASYEQELHQLADALSGLDESTARTILHNARETAAAAWLQREIRAGLESGDPVDGLEVFARLRARAEARLKN